ncbi:hypothetical protein FRC04_006500 [Tulasnella sp. 424]|nr:hypothetical protein FRC04_006500 [Tulasnella sp. 424]KAG8981040.1 hypothetical protein FRC05_003940 [Tulasnella sp. 425]
MNFQAMYPNSYIDDISPVDVLSHTSIDVGATAYAPQNVPYIQYDSSNSVYPPKPHGDILDRALSDVRAELARNKRILERSENRCKTLRKSNKELRHQVNILNTELSAEKWQRINLESKCIRNKLFKRKAETELEEVTANANLGAETNALYEHYASTHEVAAVAAARTIELEAQMAAMYGTARERAERAEREQEEREAKVRLEQDLKLATTAWQAVENENERLRAVVRSLENQLPGGAFSIKTDWKKLQSRPKKLFIKDEEEDY